MITIIMWLMISPSQPVSSERIKNDLHETQSNCMATADYLQRKGYGRSACIPVKVVISR